MCMPLVQDYITVKEKGAKFLPHTAGRYAVKRFRKAHVRSETILLYGYSPLSLSLSACLIFLTMVMNSLSAAFSLHPSSSSSSSSSSSFSPSAPQCPIVERLTNSLMMHGRNNGKKLMAVRIVKHAFEIIHLLTGEVSN